ncbi:uncharacterized protein MCYG_00988 [Microsporum canis CBS 113480]|uniref:Secreted protein n=1 Tax=Arthroderma otae (strain ATCC MYA-4605 / CBS 113480) TaxID=554155 RepID=C5FE66_ARTOC|nr:uncharacterized protein MCYG_00988 [Microsporum canis CBS 113480]EEQ28100.1 predicted protein [Microsporum canis CBS 113480]
MLLFVFLIFRTLCYALCWTNSRGDHRDGGQMGEQQKPYKQYVGPLNILNVTEKWMRLGFLRISNHQDITTASLALWTASIQKNKTGALLLCSSCFDHLLITYYFVAPFSLSFGSTFSFFLVSVLPPSDF